MKIQGEHLIGYTCSKKGTHAFQAKDPARGTVLEPVFVDATEDEIARCLALAAEAFGELKSISSERRASFLEAIGEEITNLGDELLERANAETALPIARLTGERGRTVAQLNLFAEVLREGSWVGARIDRGDADRKPIPKPDVRRMMRPLGPVVVFGASNFPLAFSVAGGDTASAFAAGCPVVVKAHPHHPGTSEMVGRAVVAAAKTTGMPAGTFSLVQGMGTEVGAALVTHPATRAVGFTGSLRGGRALFDLAVARPEPIPVYAEMGSTNPIFMLPSALRERAPEIASGLMTSISLGVGQFCTNPGLVVGMDDAATEDFIRELERLIEGASAGTMLHTGIQEAFAEGVRRLRETEGVDSHESASKPADGFCVAEPTFFTTTAATFLLNEELSEEVFGPSTLIVKCGSHNDMLDVARGLRGQLTATVQATDEEIGDHRDLIALLEEKAGRVLVNGFPTGVEVGHAMQHGGPYPATTDSRSTSVGSAAIERFARPVCYQDFPNDLLPAELKDENPVGIRRLVDGVWQ